MTSQTKVKLIVVVALLGLPAASMVAAVTSSRPELARPLEPAASVKIEFGEPEFVLDEATNDQLPVEVQLPDQRVIGRANRARLSPRVAPITSHQVRPCIWRKLEQGSGKVCE